MSGASFLLVLPPLADTWMPLVYGMEPLLVVVFIPVVAIESYVLLKVLHLKKGRAILVSALANALSTIVGFPLSMALADAIPAHFYHGHFYLGRHAPEVSPWAAPIVLVVLLIPFFVASWVSEYPVVFLLLKPKQPALEVCGGVLKANLASYLLPLLLLVGDGIYEARAPVYNPEASPVGSLRTLNTAEVTYASTFTHGYSSSLAELGPSPGGDKGPFTEAHAGLVDKELASGVKNGYTFIYTPGERTASGRIDTYTVSARPIKHGETGTNSFFTGDSGVIRYTTEDRPATAKDPPLAG
jgi:type IV pilus assembly protein PilA